MKANGFRVRDNRQFGRPHRQAAKRSKTDASIRGSAAHLYQSWDDNEYIGDLDFPRGPNVAAKSSLLTTSSIGCSLLAEHAEIADDLSRAADWPLEASLANAALKRRQQDRRSSWRHFARFPPDGRRRHRQVAMHGISRPAARCRPVRETPPR